MPNNDNQKESVVQQLLGRITDIKDRLKQDGISSVAFEELSTRAKTLQDITNNLLAKKGFYSQDDINKAYETMQADMRAELESESKKSMKRLITYSAIGVGALALLYFAIKKLRND